MSSDEGARAGGGGPARDAEPGGYFSTRFTRSDSRSEVWRHVCRYLAQWIPGDAAVLELGAGWCDFSNAVEAGSVTAMDVDPVVEGAAGPGVIAEVGDCTDLSRFDDAAFDCVVASNLLEHLTRPMADRLLAEAARVLTPDGKLILIQPNYRLNPAEYFDDYTHVSVYSDRSMRDYLSASGWRIDHLEPRFLPLSMNSRGSGLTFLVPWYLRSPIRPLAGQMLVVASGAAA